MPWFQVPAQFWLEDDDELSALETVMDLLPATGLDHRIRMSETGPANELNDDQAKHFLDFVKTLEQTQADADAGTLIADPRHPNLRFTPAAAAELAALEFEAEDAE